MHCYHCGLKIEQKVTHCPSCGTYLENLFQSVPGKYRYLTNITKLVEISGYLTIGISIILPFLIFGFNLVSLEWFIILTIACIWVGLITGLGIIFKAQSTNPQLDMETHLESISEHQKTTMEHISHLLLLIQKIDLRMENQSSTTHELTTEVKKVLIEVQQTLKTDAHPPLNDRMLNAPSPYHDQVVASH